MNTGEGQHDNAPPGQPLWERAEQTRVERGWSQEELAERIGIGRVTLMRLKTQANKPQARTVNKIADAIGISHLEAGRLAGLIEIPTAGDSMADLIYHSPDGRKIYIEIKHFNRGEVLKHIQTLRRAGEESGQTLGDVLVMTGLAEPQELKLTRNPDVGEVEDDPNLPDDVKRELVDGYRRLVTEVAELRSQMDR